MINLLALWTFSQADEKITNGSKVKVKAGTHFLEKGNLVIANNAQIIIEGMLSVDQNLSNETAFTGIQIKSNENNTGSIIFGSGEPKGQIERYMHSGTRHYVGPPVDQETAEALINNFTYSYLYDYNDGFGFNLINDYSLELINGKGYYYLIKPNYSGGITPVFEGNLKSVDMQLDNNSTPALQYVRRGTNILANPYSCAIDWDDPSIEFNELEATIWVYDPNTNNMKYRNHSGYGTLTDGIIPMGQGFLVKAQSEEATLVIPKQARRHHQQEFYKKSENKYEELNYLILELQKDHLKDEIWVGYQWNSTDEFDNGIDISKMFSYEETHQIYTSHNNDNYTIDLIAEPNFESKQIPVHVHARFNGVHQLNLSKFQGFSGVDVQLEDLLTGEFINMESMKTYEFSTNGNDEDLRFIIHFNPKSVTGINHFNAEMSQVHIFGYGDQIYIKSDGEFSLQSKTVFIYDVNGKLLTEIPLGQSHFTSIKNKFKRKMIVVKAKYKNNLFTEKVVFMK